MASGGELPPRMASLAQADTVQMDAGCAADAAGGLAAPKCEVYET